MKTRAAEKAGRSPNLKMLAITATCLALLGAAAAARADGERSKGPESTVGAGLVAGSGGVGAEMNVSLSLSDPNEHWSAEDLRAEVRLGAVSDGNNWAGTGNIGWIYRVTPRSASGIGLMLLSDPLFLHMDGVRTTFGANPLGGTGLIVYRDKYRFTVSPKLMLIDDKRSDQSAVGIGAQGTLEMELSDKLWGSAFLIASTALARHPAPGTESTLGRYAAAGVSVFYQLAPQLALNGGVEVSDLMAVKTVGANPMPNDPVVLGHFGVAKVF